MSKYVMDYDWLREVLFKDRVAQVLLTITHDQARKAARAVIEGLKEEEHGMAGRGGWSAKIIVDERKQPVVIEILSGGEDVADAVEDATDELYQRFAALGFEDCLEWENHTVD